MKNILKLTFVATLLAAVIALTQGVFAQQAVNATSLTNALSAPINAGANGANVAVGPNNTFIVGSTTNILVGMEIVIDQEAMLVTAVPVSGTVVVQRGYDGTTAASHAAGSQVYIGSVSGTPGSPFQFVDPALGSCTSANEPFTFRLNLMTGRLWTCATNGWHPSGGAIGNGTLTVFTGITNGATAVTLLPSMAGSLIVFDSATGGNFKLPPPTPGMTFDFVIKTTVTSNAAEVQTDASTTFLVGAFTTLTNAAVSAQFACNGTTHIAYKAGADTQGRLAGTYFRLVAVSSTLWQVVSDLLIVSGTAATPCSTTT